MSNRLANANSPYLLQHAENPVDWYPWGREALARAQQEQKPIFLSIGYAACHWCHVMAHESFEDPRIAELLNQNFVSIKVDREERPDLDQIYMEAVQRMTGHGGWPLSVFLTPQLQPFFGGTYWPPRRRGGMPGLDEVLQAVAQTWQQRREEVHRQAGELAQALGEEVAPASSAGEPVLDERPLVVFEEALRRTFDRRHGGFDGAPKFPPAVNLRVLLRRWRRNRSPAILDTVTTTLDRMAAGGIYDQLGGGFHRYSIDAQWLVPHFEKMLYDNALLATAYLEAWQVTANLDYARVVHETLGYVLRDMTDPLGGFYSSEDADSEGEEGRFYLWTVDEVRAQLGPERAAAFCRYYDVVEGGNFEGRTILSRAKTLDQLSRILERPAEELRQELAASREKLLAVRQWRPRPFRDDKVLVSWNGLMIEALAFAGSALDEPRYRDAAAKAASFLLEHLRDEQGRLRHYWRRGTAAVPAFLDDYASLAEALLALYEVDFDARWAEEAMQLGNEILVRFRDPQQGDFFYTPADHKVPLARRKERFDAPIPSSTGLAATVLLRLGRLCDRPDFLAAARAALRANYDFMLRAATGAGQLLLALDLELGPTPELVILGADDARSDRPLLERLHHEFLPNKVLAYRSAEETAEVSPAVAALFRGKQPVPPGPTLYLCRDFACEPPRSGEEALAAVEGL